jgi:hypothetical protein
VQVAGVGLVFCLIKNSRARWPFPESWVKPSTRVSFVELKELLGVPDLGPQAES